MAGSRFRVWLILSLTSTKTGRTVQSHFQLEKWNMMHTRLYSMPALTAIYFAMKLIMMHITVSFILPSLSARHRQNCLWDLKSIGYQIEPDSWSVHLSRQLRILQMICFS